MDSPSEFKIEPGVPMPTENAADPGKPSRRHFGRGEAKAVKERRQKIISLILKLPGTTAKGLSILMGEPYRNLAWVIRGLLDSGVLVSWPNNRKRNLRLYHCSAVPKTKIISVKDSPPAEVKKVTSIVGDWGTDLMTPPTLAKHYRISFNSLRRNIADGHLKTFTVDGKHHISKDDFLAWHAKAAHMGREHPFSPQNIKRRDSTVHRNRLIAKRLRRKKKNGIWNKVSGFLFGED